MSFPSATVTATSTPINSIPSSKRPPVNLNPSLSSHSSFTSTSSASPTPTIGVVVVGFIGTRSSTDLTHLINRLLDDNIFGSCNRDKDLPAYTILDEMGRGKNDGGNVRRITYHHEPEKGMIYLHYSASSPLRSFLLSSSILEDSEADDLRSMLLMFSVCHVIVFVHEGLQFNTQILQKFRILQAAKQALSRFVRSQIPPLASSKQSLPISKHSVLSASSISPPTRKGGSSNRHGSAISLMSGNGSHPSMLPGLCIPVLIFVFEDDFIDSSSPGTNVDDTTEAYKHNSTLKGSGSVVMLARPASKAEGSFKRRLQSSLEAQIRFLIKKCRILTGTDHIQSGSRGAGTANSLPLFLLDASRVVSLLDRSSNQRGEPLSFITRLLDEEDKVDVSILESHCVNLHNEDVQSLKDFILRQADMLRGRGGLASNVNSGSVAGVGVLAAAAAAAASVAAGKLVNTPELPSLENWLMATNQIHVALVSVGQLENIIKSASSTGTPDVQAVEDAISCLESGNGQNMKFSISWCQRVLPLAKEVYLKDLPARYPTSIHKKQLEKALVAFHSMVKGPAVKMFADKLADQCISIWEAGRQLCDAISITGKPCMHLRHDITRSDPCKEVAIDQHSSGFVFLHACACGRSRRLRDDPFDFENANITFNHFPNCENHLPSLFLSNLTIGGPLPPAAWSLVRVGGAGYYEHSKGLLQTGFCFSQNFLLKWTISTDKQTETSNLPLGVLENVSAGSLISDPKTMPELAEGKVEPSKTKLNSEVQLIFESQKEISDTVPSSAPFISFGRGLPSFTMKKPFAEVVAGMATTDLRKHKKDITSKGIYQSDLSSQNDVRSKPIDDHSASQGIELVSTQENAIKTEANCQINANPYLQIGRNIVPVEMLSNTEEKAVAMSKQSTIYVGFEHECSYGHRFLLSLEHFKNLDSSCSLTSKAQFSTNESEAKYAENKNGIPEMNDHYSSRKDTGMTSMTYDNKLNGFAAANSSLFHGSFTTLLKDGNEKIQSPHELSMSSDNVHQLKGNLSQVRLDDGSSAYSLLSRNVPVYMNCPHCSKSAKQSHQKVKFASKVSQLQRIFLVTPPFPTVLATCPVIQFEESCLPPSTLDLKQQSRFSLGFHVVLPPDSFLTLRLPFIYGVLMDDKSLQPLRHFDDKPELTAWLVKGTTLQVVSMGHESIETSQVP